MYELEILSQKIFLEKENKFIIINNNSYLNVLKTFMAIEDKNIITNTAYINRLAINSKNTLFIPLITLEDYIKLRDSNNSVIDEYIKQKTIKNCNFDRIHSNICGQLYKFAMDSYSDLLVNQLEIDIYKIIKSGIDLTIKDNKQLFEIIKYVIKNTDKPQVIFMYSKDLIEKVGLDIYVDKLKDINNLLTIQICDKTSMIFENDNITFIQETLNQITGKGLMEIIINSGCDLSREAIRKLFMFALDGKEVKIMINDIEKIKILAEILKNELNLNNTTNIN